MEGFIPYMFITMGFIVLALAMYLGFLIAELKKQRNKSRRMHDELRARRQKRDEGIYESLRIIGLAVVQDQCEISEGCIRIYKLLSLLEDLEKREEYLLFEEFYAELKGFAFLEERQKLDKQEKFNQDKERFAVEDIYRERMITSCRVLVEHMNMIQPVSSKMH